MTSVAVRSGKKLVCPGCSKPLTAVLTVGVEVDACASCGGLWVDPIDEKGLLQIRPEAFTVDELRRLRRLYEPLGAAETVRYRRCPVCEELMHRRNWGGHSGVVVDRCEKHGTWYDSGEAEKIREYVALGGVEYEKLQLQEKGLGDLNAKLKKEVSRLDARVSASPYLVSRLWTAIAYK